MTRWNNHLKTIALLGALSALLIGVGQVVAPGHFGFFAVLALGMNLGAYFFSDRLVLRMHGTREVDPAQGTQLHGMVRELAARAKIPVPRIFLIDDPQPNAFASALARLEQAAAIVPSAAAQPATASLFIVNPFADGEQLARLFSTHPATADRIVRLEAMAGGRRLES